MARIPAQSWVFRGACAQRGPTEASIHAGLWPIQLAGAAGARGHAVPSALRRSSSCHSCRWPRAAEAPSI